MIAKDGLHMVASLLKLGVKALQESQCGKYKAKQGCQKQESAIEYV